MGWVAEPSALACDIYLCIYVAINLSIKHHTFSTLFILFFQLHGFIACFKVVGCFVSFYGSQTLTEHFNFITSPQYAVLLKQK